jgi:ubiquinone/menaquinone biosynthesis C-methylase UbiE
MGLRESVVAQFQRPHGPLGFLAGQIMARRPSNIDRNRWAVDLLGLEPSDRVLEIGFGPGIAIGKAADRVTRGIVVGLDHSPAMLRVASRRNTDAIRSGLVQLHCGKVESLVTDAVRFDKIYSVNVVQFWQDPEAMFRNLILLLANGGEIATTYMPRHRGAGPTDAIRKAEEIVAQYVSAGLTGIRIERLDSHAVPAVSVIGKRPS